jgi:hypothetical protein
MPFLSVEGVVENDRFISSRSHRNDLDRHAGQGLDAGQVLPGHFGQVGMIPNTADVLFPSGQGLVDWFAGRQVIEIGRDVVIRWPSRS